MDLKVIDRKMARDDGGAAFPVPDDASDIPGMRLRDYFAGQFLTTVRVDDPEGVSAELVAKNCYRMADAMLAERAK